MKDSGSVQDFLATTTNWLDTHPKEVATLLLTNGDYVSLDYFEKAFNSSGASHHAYIPIPSHNASILSSWPTFGSLISSGKAPSSIARLRRGRLSPLILNEFTYFWETPFNTTDPSFQQCTISRPGELHEYPIIANERMIIMNHFLDTDVLNMDLPDRRDARKTNAATGTGSLGAQTALCGESYGRAPVWMLVDYVDQGEGLKARDRLN